MKSSWENQGEKGRSIINVVFVGACILIIFRRMKFRSTGQREVEEEISVLIFFTNLGRSIDLKSLYVIRFRLIFENFRFIENSIIKLSVSSSIFWKELGFIHLTRGLDRGVNIISSVLPLEWVGN